MSNFIIKYGTNDKSIDVSDICYNKLCRNNIIKIPDGDKERSEYFGDPIYGYLKSIFIIDEFNESFIFNDKTEIEINIETGLISFNTNIYNKIVKKLKNIHSNLKNIYSDFSDEFPEQIMATKYLTGYEKVLEIGGNIGRNSLVIAYILKQKNNNNLVTLESSKTICEKLINNRDINNFVFYIENSALSKRKLIQNNWTTIPSDEVLEGYEQVNTITLEELNKKYNINFDTLVLDCEGAFYYILMDMPDILNNIKLIIMENDYTNIDHKNYIDSILIDNGFYRDYFKSGGYGMEPCYNRFYEVWKK